MSPLPVLGAARSPSGPPPPPWESIATTRLAWRAEDATGAGNNVSSQPDQIGGASLNFTFGTQPVRLAPPAFRYGRDPSVISQLARTCDETMRTSGPKTLVMYGRPRNGFLLSSGLYNPTSDDAFLYMEISNTQVITRSQSEGGSSTGNFIVNVSNPNGVSGVWIFTTGAGRHQFYKDGALLADNVGAGLPFFRAGSTIEFIGNRRNTSSSPGNMSGDYIAGMHIAGSVDATQAAEISSGLVANAQE